MTLTPLPTLPGRRRPETPPQQRKREALVGPPPESAARAARATEPGSSRPTAARKRRHICCQGRPRRIQLVVATPELIEVSRNGWIGSAAGAPRVQVVFGGGFGAACRWITRLGQRGLRRSPGGG